jgi:hypothetical protein
VVAVPAASDRREPRIQERPSSPTDFACGGTVEVGIDLTSVVRGECALRCVPDDLQAPSATLLFFTTRERDLIRRELCRHFGQDPRAVDGIFLRIWRSGEREGQPKIPPAVQSMLDRGLVVIRPARLGARAFFTEAGLRELRALLQDRRAMDPGRFAHLRRELGLDHDEVAVEADQA